MVSYTKSNTAKYGTTCEYFQGEREVTRAVETSAIWGANMVRASGIVDINVLCTVAVAPIKKVRCFEMIYRQNHCFYFAHHSDWYTNVPPRKGGRYLWTGLH